MQQEKAAQNKRSKNTSKNRPVLVTSSSNDLATKDQSVEVSSEPEQPAEEVVPSKTVEDTQPRRSRNSFQVLAKAKIIVLWRLIKLLRELPGQHAIRELLPRIVVQPKIVNPRILNQIRLAQTMWFRNQLLPRLNQGKVALRQSTCTE